MTWETLKVSGALRPLDIELGRLLAGRETQSPAPLALAAAAASAAVAQGHACVPLARIDEVLARQDGVAKVPGNLPSGEDWAAMLRASSQVANDSLEPPRPLVLDSENRLYLRRYYRYERLVAEDLQTRLAQPVAAADAETLRSLLAPQFVLDDKPNWQAVAVIAGLLSSFAVIMGGPGTGKTTTALWLLAALAEQAHRGSRPSPRMALAAPTGKAAARLGEVFRTRLPKLDVDDTVRESLPVEASTLHRLLGVRGDGRFRHHAANPLPLDVLVVDEVSMVSLPLMAHLLDALPTACRLILLGDSDQLASVEAGNVLAAISEAAGSGLPTATRAALAGEACGCAIESVASDSLLANAVVALRDSHRFGSDSGLGRLAAGVLAGDSESLCTGLAQGIYADVAWEQAGSPTEVVIRRSLEHFAKLASAPSPSAALSRAQALRVLTAVHDGPTGCRALNDAIEAQLRQRGGVAEQQRWYPGRLLLILENDHDNGLYNGDIGIILPDTHNQLLAWFESADGQPRSLPPFALPAHDSAFAMTIHKSQGSEFDEVGIVLPQRDVRVLGRELLYTAITRARRGLWLVGSSDVLGAAVARSSRRYGGLADRLRQA